MVTPSLDIEFRPVDDSNIAELKQLNTAIFPVNYKDKFYKDCTSCGDVTQLAYHEGRMVGAIACRLESKGGGLARLYIMTLGVYAPYRCGGVGRRLLEHSLGVIKDDESVTQAYLHVQTSNEDAIRFYARYGFKVVEEIKNYYKRIDPPDCYVLCKQLRDEAPWAG